MPLFSRFRRSEEPDETPSLPDTLPSINQRVTVTRSMGGPIPSRIDDEVDEGLVLLAPSVPLMYGEPIILTWEQEEGWFALETTVQAVDDEAERPTVTVAKRGRLQRFSERRGELRKTMALPLDLRVVTARVVKPGRTLRTHTVELSAKALRFTTSAPLAPGDIVEIRVELPDGGRVGSRTSVIRMDSVSDSWRQVCTVKFEDMLRSDVERLISVLENHVQV